MVKAKGRNLRLGLYECHTAHTMTPERKSIKRKRVSKIENRYRLQAYIEMADKELIEEARRIEAKRTHEEGTLSGFAARILLAECRRIIESGHKSLAR